MDATIIFNNGQDKEPAINKITVDKDCETENIWETLDNIYAKLEKNNNLRPMRPGDLIKIEYFNGLRGYTQTDLFLCCAEGFIEI